MYSGKTNKYHQRTDSFYCLRIIGFVCLFSLPFYPLFKFLFFSVCHAHFSFLLTLFTLCYLYPGVGRCIQEQSWPHGCGSNLRGAKEKRHRVPNIRAGDAVTYTYTSACRRAHAWQPSLLKFLCQNYLVWLRSQVTCCLMICLLSPSLLFLVSHCSGGWLYLTQAQQHYSAHTTLCATSLHHPSSPQHSCLRSH